MMLRCVFCFLAFLLSVACVCLAGSDAGVDPPPPPPPPPPLPAAGGPCPEGVKPSDEKPCTPAPSGAKAESPGSCPAGHTPSNDETCSASPAVGTSSQPGVSPSPPVGGGKDCTQGKTDLPCPTTGSEREDAPTEDCTKASGRGNCVANGRDGEGRCNEGSNPNCSSARGTDQASHSEPGSIGSPGVPVTCSGATCASVAGGLSGGGTHIQPQTKRPAQTPAPAETPKPAGTNAQEGPQSPSDKPGTEASDSHVEGAGDAGAGSDAAASEGGGGASPAGDPQSGESGRNENGAANTSSPANSDTEGSSGSSAAT
ncbi:uncharacterized protein TM35_001141110, partial [Trypanosoma theileri]